MVVRVGLIGASPDHGWAFRSHVPAIESVSGLTVSAVATTREDSARRAASLVGVDAWFTSARELAASPQVDVVAVIVRVPFHRELVEEAYAAGKHVMSEWPLALDHDEAAALVDHTPAGLRTFVGLQGRFDPAVREARRLIRADELGPIQAVSAWSSHGKGVGGRIVRPFAYTLDASTGAGNSQVHGGHFVDLLDRILGGIAAESMLTSQRRSEYQVDDGSSLEATAPDTMTLTFRTAGAALGTAVMWDGAPSPQRSIVVVGERSTMWLEGRPGGDPGSNQPQMSAWSLRLQDESGVREVPTAVHMPDLRLEARNTAALWEAVRDDVVDGSGGAPTFSDALRLHELIAA